MNHAKVDYAVVKVTNTHGKLILRIGWDYIIFHNVLQYSMPLRVSNTLNSHYTFPHRQQRGRYGTQPYVHDNDSSHKPWIYSECIP